MRILLCNWRDLRHPRAGGAEVFTHEVLRRWVRDGHDVTMFASRVPGAASEESVDGVRVIRAGGRFGVYRAARQFFDSQHPGHFDVVIDEINTRPFDAPSFAGDTPVVALAHQVAREVWFSEFAWPIAAVGAHILEPHWLRRYRYVPTITISESSRESLESFGLQRVSVVTPPGAAAPHSGRHEAKEARPTLLFVGRLAANKRPDHAIEAFSELRRRIPDAQLWVVGDGVMLDRLTRRQTPGVTLFGHVDDMTKLSLMSRAHLLVATSVREGWGMVVDEAAAAGTATVAYDVAGLRDSVARAGGLLVEASPAALADCLSTLLPEVAADAARLPPVRSTRTWDDVAAEILRAVRRMTIANGSIEGHR